MTVEGQPPSRLSWWSPNQSQLHSWCCNQIHGDCWILIIFTGKWLRTKNQREKIRGHWKMLLLMTALPSLQEKVLIFPLSPSPSSVSLSFESLTRQRRGNRKKKIEHLNPPPNCHWLTDTVQRQLWANVNLFSPWWKKFKIRCKKFELRCIFLPLPIIVIACTASYWD